ncbi:MAG: hypothetical protein HUU35_12730, partial [Armatimonadetes bacterium]|nr:hypothetical protein [Armatimonadota bacterium]
MRVIPLLALLLPLAATALERETIELAGSWETVRADGLKSVPETGWTSFEVPGTVSGFRYTASWFRRAVDIPASWQGRRVAIRFGGVRWNSRVYVNEQLAGGHFNGFDAFELDALGDFFHQLDGA